MRNKKTFMVVGLIVAVLVMGIAYAGISNVTLLITGSADVAVEQGNFAVAFSSDPADTQAGASVETATATANVTGDLEATLAVSGLTTEEQYGEAMYTITNKSDLLAADLTAKTEWTSKDGTQDWFDVSYEFEKTTLQPGESTKVIVMVTLMKTPITDTDVANASCANLKVTVTAAPTQPTTTGGGTV